MPSRALPALDQPSVQTPAVTIPNGAAWFTAFWQKWMNAVWRIILALWNGAVWQETPGGAVDGMNAAFTLQYSPNPPQSLQLFAAGLLLNQGVDYTIVGTAITFPAAPKAATVLIAYYNYFAIPTIPQV